ncbi:MAG: hypothetical protein IEMM0006_0554 [bacterium]|nr:MAG: hypothetical protein IEMM0006_0554 [bacterium]
MLSMMRNMYGIDFLKGNNNLSLFQSLQMSGLIYTGFRFTSPCVITFQGFTLESMLNNDLQNYFRQS